MTVRSCRLMSWDGDLPVVGEFLRTRAGTTYAVIGVRPNRMPQPRSLARLELLRLAPGDEVPAGAAVHRFIWHPRPKAGRRRAI